MNEVSFVISYAYDPALSKNTYIKQFVNSIDEARTLVEELDAGRYNFPNGGRFSYFYSVDLATSHTTFSYIGNWKREDDFRTLITKASKKKKKFIWW